MNKTMINFMFNIEIRKKILCLFLTITIILSITIGVAKCVPVTEYIDGLKIFSDGVTVKNSSLTVTDANSVAKFSVDSNGNVNSIGDCSFNTVIGNNINTYSGRINAYL